MGSFCANFSRFRGCATRRLTALPFCFYAHPMERNPAHRSVPPFWHVVILMLLIGAYAAPHQVSAADDGPEVPITADELERFISDWPAFTAAARAGSVAFDPHRYLLERGWEPERFLLIAGRVTEGLVALEREDQAEAVSAELEQRRRVILESPDLTPRQRERMIASLNQTLDEVRGEHGLSADELELIRRNRDPLRALIDAIY